MKILIELSHCAMRITLICAIILSFTSSTDAQKKSVVRIIVNDATGYGIAWGEPDHIVTALHLVAGKRNINIEWEDKKTTAQIVKIYKPSGLALLKLDESFNITPLRILSGNAPYGEQVNYYEIDQRRCSITEKTSDLMDETKLNRLNPRISNNTNLLINTLCYDDGSCYPILTTKILKLEEPNIRVEHSGSPVTYKKKIIGMIDCSPKRINGSLCFWVIPANDFNILLKQPAIDTPMMASCMEPEPIDIVQIEPDSLYLSEIIIGGSLEGDLIQDESVPIKFRDPSGDRLTLKYIKSVRFEVVWETLFSEHVKYVSKLANSDSTFDAQNPSLFYELLNQSIDFYTEIETGISIAIPAGTELGLSKDGFGKLVTAESPNNLSRFSIYISACKNQAKSTKAFNEFSSMIYDLGIDTIASEENITDFSTNANNPYYSQYIIQDSTNGNGVTVAKFLARSTISNNNFLGVTVDAPEWAKLNARNERIYYYLLLICARLTDFPIH